MSEDANVQYLDQKSYAAKYDRQPFRDILTEGIITSGALEITELDTPGMGVKSAKGRALVQGDQSEWQGHYGIRNDASKNLTIAASDPTNPRKDRIIAQIYDSTDIGGALDKWVLEVLTGTPAASPVAPNLPNDALDLAIVLVGNGVTEITNANITDQRVQIKNQNIIIDADTVDEKHAVDLGIVTYSGAKNAPITLAASQNYDVITIANVIVPSGAKVLLMAASVISNDSAVKNCNLAFYRDAVEVRKGGQITKGLAANSYIGFALNYVDSPDAETYTYKLIIAPRDGVGQIIDFDYCSMNILVLKNAT